MKNISDKSCKENQITHFIFSNFSWKSYRLWDNVEKYSRTRQVTGVNVTRRMRFKCWITTATDTHSEYVIVKILPLHQWLRARASILQLYYFLVPVCNQRCATEEPWFDCRQGQYTPFSSWRPQWIWDTIIHIFTEHRRLATHTHLLVRLRMNRSVPPLPLMSS